MIAQTSLLKELADVGIVPVPTPVVEPVTAAPEDEAEIYFFSTSSGMWKFSYNSFTSHGHATFAGLMASYYDWLERNVDLAR